MTGNVVNPFERLYEVIHITYGIVADAVLDYFEDTYIGRFRGSAARGAPLFSIEMWNMFHRTNQEMSRTNKHIERWHRRFQSLYVSYYPEFWKFIQLLEQEHSVNRVELLQAAGGHSPRARRWRYVDCNERILAILDDYPNRDTIRYLQSIAHYLGF